MKVFIFIIIALSPFRLTNGQLVLDNREQVIWSTTTQLSDDDIRFLKHEDRVFAKITLTGPFGYSQHIVIGEIFTKFGGWQKTALFQTYKFEESTRNIHVIRRMIEPVENWSFLNQWIRDDRLQKYCTPKNSADQKSRLDGSTIYVEVKYENVEYSFTSFAPDDKGELWKWIYFGTSAFGVEFSQ